MPIYFYSPGCFHTTVALLSQHGGDSVSHGVQNICFALDGKSLQMPSIQEHWLSESITQLKSFS